MPSRSGKGAKARRIVRRRAENAGSYNVKQKRARYKRWAKLNPKQRAAARSLGAKQFVKEA